MIVYHGSTLKIEKPDVSYSKSNLDFGKGFYVTTIKSQAEKWASRKSLRFGGQPTVNVYQLGELSDCSVKNFIDADEEWLDFVVACRNGEDIYRKYDVIIGQVADDEVFKCVNMYMDGIWDKDRTLEEIRYINNNNQIVFINQQVLNEKLVFQESYEV